MAGETLVQRVRETIHRHRMLAPGEMVVVAASGGPDSTALLHVLADLREALGVALHAAHFDHRLRPESAEDAAFAAALSHALGIPHHEGAGETRAEAERRHLSVEDAARRLRYEFLTTVARASGAQAVATGHTLDDQAETVLMRVLRGSGLRGLAGIPPVRRSGPVRLVRPLLDVARREILAFLNDRGISWREDPTNRDQEILRNRIRMVLLPVVEGYNPDARRTLARLAGLMRDEAEALDALAAPLIAGVLGGGPGPGAVQIAREPFLGLPAALQRRALREAVRRVRGNVDGVAFVHIEGARVLMSEGKVGGIAELPGGVRVTILPGTAEVTARTDRTAGPPEYRVDVPGNLVAPEFGIHLAVTEVDVAVPNTGTARPRPGIEAASTGRGGTDDGGAGDMGAEDIMVDAGRAGGWLILRGPRPGDRFAPSGMGGRTKKLADYLSDAKVPRHRRRFVPVLTAAGGDILWVVGMRAAEGIRIPVTGDVLAHGSSGPRQPWPAPQAQFWLTPLGTRPSPGYAVGTGPGGAGATRMIRIIARKLRA